MHSAAADRPRGRPGCPIRIRTDQRSYAAPRPRFAALRVLLRRLAPRHPPNTLNNLACTQWCFPLYPQTHAHLGAGMASLVTVAYSDEIHVAACRAQTPHFGK